MKVTVKFFASVREIVGAKTEQIEVADGATLDSVWQGYIERFPKLAPMGLAYAVNHEYSDMGRVLKDGDEVAFIPPVSGG
jgi:molybdopterin converting factor subunit 1